MQAGMSDCPFTACLLHGLSRGRGAIGPATMAVVQGRLDCGHDRGGCVLVRLGADLACLISRSQLCIGSVLDPGA